MDFTIFIVFSVIKDLLSSPEFSVKLNRAYLLTSGVFRFIEFTWIIGILNSSAEFY